jgi:sugar/nucleoside kinase (ribokinase family)
MSNVVYDSGALVAADKNDRRLWAEHKVRLELGVVPLVPAPVLAQVSRSPRQVQLRRLLAGCDVVTFGEQEAHRVGALLARSKTRDVIDAAVVVLAMDKEAVIVTSDPKDMAHLAAALKGAVTILTLS